MVDASGVGAGAVLMHSDSEAWFAISPASSTHLKEII